MRSARMLRPLYSANFRCIAQDCEDDCCTGWAVTLDRKSYDKYKAMESSPLFPLFQQHVIAPGDQLPSGIASGQGLIAMLPDGRCPFLSAEKLCRIQLEHGAEWLSQTCQTYPRRHSTIDGLQETALMLSCPAAARLVLLDEQLGFGLDDGHSITWEEKAGQKAGVRSCFWEIRETSVRLLLDRRYPLWQRLFLLGFFSRRLEAIESGQLDRSVPEMMADFSQALQSGALRSAMETMGGDVPLQLDLLAGLLKERMAMEGLRPKFATLLAQVIEAMGFGKDATVEGCVSRYEQAARLYAEPFFAAHPQLLENYLTNLLFTLQFPCGTSLYEAQAEIHPEQVYRRIAVEFALLRVLLVGRAGYFKEEFSVAHVVETVSAAYRAFDHAPEFFERALAMLKQRGADDARGMTMLLRT